MLLARAGGFGSLGARAVRAARVLPSTVQQRGYAWTKKEIELMLTKPVAGLGERGDIVKVKRGYARHRLVPSGVGVRTDLARDMLTARAKMEAEDVLERADLQGLVQRLKASSVFEFASETSAKGGALLTPIQAADMVAAFSREFGAQLNGAKLSPAVLTSTELLDLNRLTI
ncbi:hypothetical protein T492DRAFT_1152689 [Pavlovales sp. CCMP2436]|nr:hypothetical protein T492DRAFT_1152689 [Pavlovales sp. CCMP2436]